MFKNNRYSIVIPIKRFLLQKYNNLESSTRVRKVTESRREQQAAVCMPLRPRGAQAGPLPPSSGFQIQAGLQTGL